MSRILLIFMLTSFYSVSTSCQKPDPWVGDYSVNLNGNPTGAEVNIQKRPTDYLITINGDLEYHAQASDKGLSGKDELGGGFTLQKSDTELLFTIGGRAFQLHKKATGPVPQQPVPEPVKPELNSSELRDPFVGSYSVNFMGEESNRPVVIGKSGEETYKVQFDQQYLEGRLHGGIIYMKDESGNTINIENHDGRLTMVVMDLFRMEMKRKGDAPANPKSGNESHAQKGLDPELLGTWERSESYPGSGDLSFSMSTIVEYTFNEDGSYEHSSRVIGGTSDVGGDSRDSGAGRYFTEYDSYTGERFVTMNGDRVWYNMADGGQILQLGKKNKIFSRK